MPKKTVEELKAAYLQAEQEYQFAMASGDRDRLTKAIGARNKAWSAFNKAKKAEFNARKV